MEYFYTHTTLLIPPLPDQAAFLPQRRALGRFFRRRKRNTGTRNLWWTIVQQLVAAQNRRGAKPTLRKIQRKISSLAVSLILMQSFGKL